MINPAIPVDKELVLVGGGHAHVSVLKSLGMKPVDGLRITLITRDIHTPYSGMLPGHIAGHYTLDECHIDLLQLARFANARLYHGEVTKLDPDNRLLHVNGRPPVSYDVLSINSGSRPGVGAVTGAEDFSLVAKPVDVFLTRWQTLKARVTASSGEFRICVIGGGAGGVELTLSIQHRLKKILRENGDDPSRLTMTLLTDQPKILPTHNEGVRKRFLKVLASRGVSVLTSHPVCEIRFDRVLIGEDTSLPSDATVFVTSASAPTWVSESRLSVDTGGFIRVDEYLRSTSHPDIFAAGDIASLPQPRAKSGVFAVRQGPVLADNLRQFVAECSLHKYRPQRRFLGLISTGNKNAVASWGKFSWQGTWLWTWKDWIDRRFMNRFNSLPAMSINGISNTAPDSRDDDVSGRRQHNAMRCGGCGAKVGSTILEGVLNQLSTGHRSKGLASMESRDDASLISIPDGKILVQSVDYFRAFVDDPYTFGAIAANHALGDIYAMGAKPQSVLAVATIPYGRDSSVKSTLYDLLAGALDTLEPTGALLNGGHTSEGPELAFGLTVNGFADPDRIWRKRGLRPGDALILTKPIGTGTLLAADMRGKAKGRWVEHAIRSMRVSNLHAASCLQGFDIGGCTDITGFGVIGHLVEMTRASGVSAELIMDNIPLLEGAVESVQLGIVSTLQPQNLKLESEIVNLEQIPKDEYLSLLFDPQTAGGLLFSVAENQADSCISRLKQLGYQRASIVGKIHPRGDQSAAITITS
ncbi:MAG: selenide, water dikinase SelD [Pseudomonadota bacterium]